MSEFELSSGCNSGTDPYHGHVRTQTSPLSSYEVEHVPATCLPVWQPSTDDRLDVSLSCATCSCPQCPEIYRAHHPTQEHYLAWWVVVRDCSSNVTAKFQDSSLLQSELCHLLKLFSDGSACLTEMTKFFFLISRLGSPARRRLLLQTCARLKNL